MCAPQAEYELCRRHTASHVMSMAVKMLHPEVTMGVGPWTETGFYQDYDLGEVKLSDKDFKKIEKKMRWIVNKDFAVVRRTVPAAEAREKFGHDPYKMELIADLVAKDAELTFYDFVNEAGEAVYSDLCAGPHLERTGEVGTFKLMKIAGAYWRGDADREMLTRLYGVAFATKEDLGAYLTLLEEAAKRDHRKLGKELDLFCFSEIVGSGLPLFTPKGTFLREKIAGTIKEIQERYGFTAVHIPHITKKDLYETSGHWQKYQDDLFHVKGKGQTEFVMKPMNCPHHTQIYASRPRSYRDLPLRLAETTMCYRDEQPGELLGLSRVRGFTQDDGHTFCRMDQVKAEVTIVVNIIREFYTKLGMFGEGQYRVSLSVRDSENLQKYLGLDANWDRAEQMLQEVAEEQGLNYERIEGEAAFYGPKLDFLFRDAIGREWQLATAQLDFVMPERFGLAYINEQGEKEQPVMIHRAIAGSLERFMSVIIEHFAGAFPLWLSPVQAHICPVVDRHVEAAYDLRDALKTVGGRAEVIDPSDTLGKRLRNAQTQKVPLTLIVGDSEVADGTVTVRKYGEKQDETVTQATLVEMIAGAK